VAELSHPAAPLAEDGTAVRPWRDSDAPSVAAFGLDEINVRWGDVPAGADEGQARAWIAEMESQRRAGRGLSFAIVDADTDAVLGCCDLRIPLPAVGEVGYLLDPDARGRGVMKRALRLVVAWSFGELKLCRVQAFVSPDNDVSMRLLQSLGFQREGLLRSYRGPGRDRVAFAVLPDELRGP
jgi:RimJ/RimL family protein N-acetyltransferase